MARAVRPSRESCAAACADGHPLRSIRAAVPSHVGDRRVSARRGLHADVARRLLPICLAAARALAEFRSRGWRARQADHVEATAFVWQELVPCSRCRVCVDVGAPTIGRRPGNDQVSTPLWPMPRHVRLSLPDAPGVYRMLRTSGDVLYIGKASSLHHRVNSYFRKQHGVRERLLEMLSQARAIFEVTSRSAAPRAGRNRRHRRLASRHDPDRALWFTSPDPSARSPQPSPRPLGPFARRDANQFATHYVPLSPGSRGPDDHVHRRLRSAAPTSEKCINLSARSRCCLARACGGKVGGPRR
jgi:hypothetical protein